MMTLLVCLNHIYNRILSLVGDTSFLLRKEFFLLQMFEQLFFIEYVIRFVMKAEGSVLRYHYYTLTSFLMKQK